MTDEALRKLFHSVLIACLGGPSVLGAAAACSGSERSVPRDGGSMPDAIRIEASTHGDAGACGNVGSGGDGCGPGCVSSVVCHGATPEYLCDCDAGVDAGLSCNPDRTAGFYLPLSCIDGGVPDGGDLDGGRAECQKLCGSTLVSSCGEVESSMGLVLGCYVVVGYGGRRPAGFKRGRGRRGSVVGQYFARMGELEAASVGAFLTMHRELAAHGAPEVLASRAQRAARDEVRHTRMTLCLARRAGGAAIRRPRRAAVAAVRSLESIATENAVEGCVRETFGALTAMVQASTASDPRVRATMARIAVDETRHAALSWDVAAWAEGRLGDDARARVRAARQAAIDELCLAVGHEPPASLQAEVGLPDARTATRLMRAMQQHLWAS